MLLTDSDFEPLTRAEWVSILRLSTMWEFVSIREKAIAELSQLHTDLSVFDKILLAKECKVVAWLLDGYCELVAREQILTPEEAEMLGWETAVRLFRVREIYRKEFPTQPTAPITDPLCSCDSCKSFKGKRPFREERREAVEREFEIELKGMSGWP